MRIEELKKIAETRTNPDDEGLRGTFIMEMDAHIDEILAVVEAAKEMQGEALINGCWYTFLPCEYAENVDIALKFLEEK